MATEILKLEEAGKVFTLKERDGKTIGLITGCFDILHQGHLALFTFAKKHCDILVVGVENDETVKRSKGKKRPVNDEKTRIGNLAKIKEVNCVFPIKVVATFGRGGISDLYLPILKKIKPDFLITNIWTDKYWRKKEKVLKGLGIKLIKHQEKIPISTTRIIERKKTSKG